ncbi:MAG: EF-hand domain-containing protein [archaeon]|nr:EF-hand domain-containing protein [archaeon]
MFDKYDFDRSGNITAVEFREMVYEMGYYLSERELKMALLMLDTDGDGKVSYPEFLVWWRNDNRFKKLQLNDDQYNLMQHCAAYFQWFDKDSSGTLSKAEFRDCHADLVRNRVTDAAFEACFATLDRDGDGNISFNEYVDWLISIGSINLSSDDTTQLAPLAEAPEPAVEVKRSEEEKKTQRELTAMLQRAETVIDMKEAPEAKSAPVEADGKEIGKAELRRMESTLTAMALPQPIDRQQRLATMRAERLSFYRQNTPAVITQQLQQPGGEERLTKRLQVMREQSESLLLLKKPIDHSCKHSFGTYKFKQAAFCHYCATKLWGDARTGVRCRGCQYVVHDGACRDAVDPKRLQRNTRRVGLRERIKNRSRSPKPTEDRAPGKLSIV